MARQQRSRKIRQTRMDPAEKLARSLLPAAQVRPGAFSIVDVQNHSEADQRAAVRSGETRTIRRTPKLMQLVHAKAITKAEAETCQWYIDQHCAGFDTVGITANYGGSLGAGATGFTHLSRHKAQADARRLYEQAKAAIHPLLVPLFEKVVLHGRPIGRLGRSFRLAIAQLEEHLVDTGEAA